MPQPRHQRPVCISIRISKQEMEELQRMAKALDRTPSYVLGMALRDFLYASPTPLKKKVPGWDA